MAIDGIIILDGTGRPIIQSGFRSKSTAYPLLHIDVLNNELQKTTTLSDIDPVLYVPPFNSTDTPSACCHVSYSDVHILCPVSGDVDPLVAFAFVDTFIEILREYFGSVSAGIIKENFDVVYQLFEETLDAGGHPLTTHSNALRDIVIPPSLLNKLLSSVAGPNVHSTLNAGVGSGPFSSPIAWRKSGVRHANNEIYFDMVEELKGVVNKHGTTVTSLVRGKIESNSKLSGDYSYAILFKLVLIVALLIGTPDCLLHFTNPQVLADCAFHPCVRLKRWSREKVLSFVPPDGRFTLLDYRYSNIPRGATTPAAIAAAKDHVPIPFLIKASIDLDNTGGVFEVKLTSRMSTHTFENVVVEMGLGEGASGIKCVVSRASGGFGSAVGSGTGESGASWAFDARRMVLKWEIPSMPPSTTWSIQGSFLTSRFPRPSRAIRVRFDIPAHTFSSLKVDQLKITGENYKPFKGVRGRSSVDVEWRW
ncbi:hypothetical protein PM082_004941 [Marasmius tenuissimus]|nr:hypothetical protein PM082_004941 [Marasmius tenuissimus]